MTQLTPSIAEDIQMLVNFWLEPTSIYRPKEMIVVAERVEVYLSTFKPDHL